MTLPTGTVLSMADRSQFTEQAMEFMPALYSAALRMTRILPTRKTSSRRLS